MTEAELATKFAEYLHQERSRLVKRGMALKREKGMRMNRPPLGYRMVRIDGEPYMEPDPASFPVRGLLKTLSRSGQSIRSICRTLEERGLRNNRGKPFAPSTVHLLLRNLG